MLHAAFPMGLPEWDTVRLTLEGEAGLDGTQVREREPLCLRNHPRLGEGVMESCVRSGRLEGSCWSRTRRSCG